MLLLVIVRRGQHARQRENTLVVHGYVELVAEVVAPAVPPHPGIRVGEPSPVIPGMAYAPGLDEAGVEDHVNLPNIAPPEKHDDLLVYYPPQPLGSHQVGEAAEDGAGVAPLVVLDEAEPPEPLVDVECPGQLPEAPHLLHAHYYEGPEEAEGAAGRARAAM